MSDKPDVIDQTETLIAHLICADGAAGESNVSAAVGTAFKDEWDAGKALRFDAMRPNIVYTFDPQDGNREFALDPGLLITSVPDILGRESEIAIMKDDRCSWTGYRRLAKPPRGVWVGGKAAAIYEVHWREIFPSGRSTYFKRAAAISPQGRPLPCIVEGSHGSHGNNDSQLLILAASVIEDVGRTGCFTTTVQEAASVVFSVPYGSQVELFKLRDGPLSPSGRRKAIMHWVSKHVRNRGGVECDVKEHLRGVHEFQSDGLKVRLEPNDEPISPAKAKEA